MTLTQPAPPSSVRPPRGRPRVWSPVVLAAASAATYVVFLVMPWFVNGLYRFPAAEVAGGMHDPSGLWPYDLAVVGVLFSLGALLTLMVSPLAAAFAGSWAVLELWRGRASGAARTSSSLALVLAAAVWAFILSPLGLPLIGWILD